MPTDMKRFVIRFGSFYLQNSYPKPVFTLDISDAHLFHTGKKAHDTLMEVSTQHVNVQPAGEIKTIDMTPQ